jgi:hypothetical protein
MKKTYSTPAIAATRDVIIETRGGGIGEPDVLGQSASAGSVGFYL